MTEETQTGTNLAKCAVAKRILEKGIVKVHCDPRVEGVNVPPHLSEDPVLLLQFAYGFRLPSFQVDEEAISGVLNFNGLKYHCVVPWESVFALTAPEFGHEGNFWPEAVPPEMLETIEQAVELRAEEPEEIRPGLSVVRDVVELSPVEQDENESEEAPVKEVSVQVPRSGRPHLRLVTDD